MSEANPTRLPRDRKSNFTAAESCLIAERASAELELLKGSFSNSITSRKKTEMWKKITEEVNAIGICFRTEEEVRTKYRNMSRGAKEKYSLARKHARGTGGGPLVANQQISEAESLIIESMRDSASYNGVEGGIESSLNVNDSHKQTDKDDLTPAAAEAIWENALDRHHRNLPVNQPAENSSTADSVDPPSLPQRTAALRNVTVSICLLLYKQEQLHLLNQHLDKYQGPVVLVNLLLRMYMHDRFYHARVMLKKTGSK